MFEYVNKVIKYCLKKKNFKKPNGITNDQIQIYLKEFSAVLSFKTITFY